MKRSADDPAMTKSMKRRNKLFPVGKHAFHVMAKLAPELLRDTAISDKDFEKSVLGEDVKDALVERWKA